MSNKISAFTALVIVMLGALLTWSFYRLLYTASGDLLLYFGVVNDYWQNGLIVIIAGTILYIVGKRDIMKYLK